MPFEEWQSHAAWHFYEAPVIQKEIYGATETSFKESSFNCFKSYIIWDVWSIQNRFGIMLSNSKHVKKAKNIYSKKSCNLEACYQTVNMSKRQKAFIVKNLALDYV